MTENQKLIFTSHAKRTLSQKRLKTWLMILQG
jgi:hypothetical protein